MASILAKCQVFCHLGKALEVDRRIAKTCLARLAARIDESARRAKPRVRRPAEADAGKGSSLLVIREVGRMRFIQGKGDVGRSEDCCY